MRAYEQPAKAIYVANRHPRMSRGEFRERWMRHADNAALVGPELAAVRNLRYCLALEPHGVLDVATDEHDGVALLALRSSASIPRFHRMLTDNEIAYADELRTFERPVEETTLCTASELVVEGRETDVVVLWFARWSSRAGAEEHLAQLAQSVAETRSHEELIHAGVRRWVRNVLVAPAPRGFLYDTVEELWFESVTHVAAAASAVQNLLEERTAHADPRTTRIIVAEVVHRAGRDHP